MSAITREAARAADGSSAGKQLDAGQRLRPAEPPTRKAGRPEVWFRARVAPALRATHGNVTKAAELLRDSYKLPCSSNTLYQKVAKDKYLQQVIKQAHGESSQKTPASASRTPCV